MRRAAVLILTHRRPDRQYTLQMLERQGYTGPVYLVVDDMDPTLGEYQDRYGEQVLVFSKADIRRTFDVGDNLPGSAAVVFARNGARVLAEGLGLTHYVELDDDYQYMAFNYDPQGRAAHFDSSNLPNLDRVFAAYFNALDAMPERVVSLAMAQTGDFIGRVVGQPLYVRPNIYRKAMNVFFHRLDRPYQFPGRINEDVNAYTYLAGLGTLHMTHPMMYVYQLRTQQNPGGMTVDYLDKGTWVKTAYSILRRPDAVRAQELGPVNRRVHHRIDWERAVPRIVRETIKRRAVDAIGGERGD